ncbi:dual specificity tyrosine-phosphorylation-regulated kinase 3 [Myxozyma melibiosi]|uniref:Dual specificity tyrosine-phosphorylation-regulated kinase 3 n=1 Tax=Myxozyma melibiosi TaxID=54550 RepID=A0ABR1F6F2_9ASCO
MTSTLAPPRMLSQSDSSRSRNKRATNWDDFYRNGYPTDIITIEDDTPPPVTAESDSTSSRGSGSTSSSTSASSSSTMAAATSSISSILLNNSVSTPRSSHPASSTQPPPQHQSNYALSYSAQQQQLQQQHLHYLPQHQHSPANIFEVNQRSAIATSTSSSIATLAVQSRSTTGRRRNHADVGVSTATDPSSSTIHNGYRPNVEVSKRRKVEYDSRSKKPQKATEVSVKVVNDTYPSKTTSKVDDDDGHYIIIPNSDLTTRYRITKLLGQGTFGKVVAAYDNERQTYCAIKIIRAVPKYRDASKIELRVLRTLSMHDKNNANRCIHLRDCFDYRNHICIVTDLLSISVFDFLKSNEFAPFPSSHIQKFAKQLLTSVAFLHELNLIHTDLKPENILLVDNSYHSVPYGKSGTEFRKVLNNTDIHLIDFGSATFQDEYHSSVVSTRHYRAPEIILGMGWSFPCDMWSIGCILVEFFTGEALFQTHDNVEHLAMMEVVVGSPFERSFSRLAGAQAQSYFTRSGKLDYPTPQTSKSSKKYVRMMKSLDKLVPPTDSFHEQFLDLLERIFVYNPTQRITAREALNHPWFNETSYDEGFSTSAI